MLGIQHKLINADPADPQRCQANDSRGQCPFVSVEGMADAGLLADADIKDYKGINTCPKHGGTSLATRREKKKVHDYRLQLWQERIQEFSESDKVKTLRGEIGILRMLIENLLVQCENPKDLMLFSGKIGDLVMKTEKLVSSCDRLESRLGMLMDKSAALAMAEQIVSVISEHIKEVETVDLISSGIIDAIANVTGEKNVSTF